MDEEQKIEDPETESGEMQSWLQDNFRVIVSIIIVVAIAGGIYSYSKRVQPTIENASEKETQLLDQPTDTEDKESVSDNEENAKEEVSSIATSQETEISFVEKAEKGNGATHLARRALANYLEKNPDSSLTAEHKIYIEDYLRKNAGFAGKVRVGTSIEFSKDLIKQAVEKSKNLNERQLNNLHKYAVRVPSLS